MMILAILLLPLSVFGTTYFVAPNGNDNNSGIQNQSWQTYNKATDILAASDTLYIKAGTYKEELIPKNSGTVGNFIIYMAYPGDEVIIDGTNITLPEWECGLITIELTLEYRQ